MITRLQNWDTFNPEVYNLDCNYAEVEKRRLLPEESRGVPALWDSALLSQKFWDEVVPKCKDSSLLMTGNSD